MAQRTTLAKRLGGGDVSLDAAVMRLDDDSMLAEDAHFLGMQDVDVRDWMSPTSKCLLYGFPASKVRADAPRRQIRGENVSVICPRNVDASTRHAGTSSDTHVMFELDPSEMLSNTGIRRGPHPRGMSGCGVWSLPELDDRSAVRSGKCIGIFTDFHASERMGVASRLSSHLELIRHRWPELSAMLPNHGKLSARVHDVESTGS